jgi:hypothetical protein
MTEPILNQRLVEVGGAMTWAVKVLLWPLRRILSMTTLCQSDEDPVATTREQFYVLLCRHGPHKDGKLIREGDPREFPQRACRPAPA